MTSVPDNLLRRWQRHIHDVPNLNIRDAVLPRLYQGGHLALEMDDVDDFDLVVSMAMEIPPRGHGKECIWIRLDDATYKWGRHPELIAKIEAAADRVVETLEEGGKVLIVCNMGINRSGLLTGIALRKMGLPGRQAVQRIRDTRNDWVLSNDCFERAVHNWPNWTAPDEPLGIGFVVDKTKATSSALPDEAQMAQKIRAIAAKVSRPCVKASLLETADMVEAGVVKTAIIKPCRKQDIDPERPLKEQRVCLYSKKHPDKLLGRHPDEESARRQEMAIKANH